MFESFINQHQLSEGFIAVSKACARKIIQQHKQTELISVYSRLYSPLQRLQCACTSLFYFPQTILASTVYLLLKIGAFSITNKMFIAWR